MEIQNISPCNNLRKQQKPLLVPTGADVAAAGSAALVDVFQIDDLLDFSNEDIAGPIGTEADSLLAVNSCSSSLPAPVPSSAAAVQQKAEAFDHLQAAAASSYDDLEELEWASRFLDDSFPQQQQKYEKATSPVSVLEQQTSATSSELTSTGSEHSLDHFCTAVTVPGRARSKRSRSSAGGKKWTSGMILPSTATTTTTTTSCGTNEISIAPSQWSTGEDEEDDDAAVLRCRHCQTQRTPQWRTGPMGPKTLCNACGVRYKSGRLLPEYRPASSPAYIPHKHSNSHKKVLEMRRQRELTE
ncbi:unnamed protein product, partial [Sphagnum jensenii]